jgi:hypothetical protein
VLLGDVRGIVRSSKDTTTLWNARQYLCALEEGEGAAWVREHAPDRSPAIVIEPLHGAWFLEDRPALRMPYDDAGVDTLRRRFGARWLITTERDQAIHLPAWAGAPPAWARAVHHADAASYAPQAVAEGYRYASPVLVYQLDPPGQ